MIRRARILLMQSHSSQPHRGTGLLLAVTASALEPCSSPSIPSPKLRPFTWQDAEDDAYHRRLWLTHSLLLQPQTWQANRYSSTAVRLLWRPYRDALQTSVSIERQFSVFSLLTLGHSLWCLSRALRHGVVLLSRHLPEQVCKPRQRTPHKLLPGPSKKALLGAWERGTSRRFAQECPEGNPGKYKQEK